MRRKKSEPAPTAQPASFEESEQVAGHSAGDYGNTFGTRRKVPAQPEGFGRVLERDEEPEGFDLVDLIGRY